MSAQTANTPALAATYYMCSVGCSSLLVQKRTICQLADQANAAEYSKYNLLLANAVEEVSETVVKNNYSSSYSLSTASASNKLHPVYACERMINFVNFVTSKTCFMGGALALT